MSDDKATNIKRWHTATLDMIQQKGPIALVSCFVNGEPTAAIAVLTQNEDESWEIEPRFVGVTPGMELTDHEGVATAASTSDRHRTDIG